MNLAEHSFIPTILTRIETHVHEKGWDQPATLYSIRGIDRGELIEIDVADVCVFGLIHIIAGASSAAVNLMAAGAETATQDGDPIHINGLLGIVIADEAHMVMRPATWPHPVEPIRDQPDASERRIVLFVGIDGSTRLLTRDRATGRPEWHTASQEIGDLTVAMRRLIAAISHRADATLN